MAGGFGDLIVQSKIPCILLYICLMYYLNVDVKKFET